MITAISIQILKGVISMDNRGAINVIPDDDTITLTYQSVMAKEYREIKAAIEAKKEIKIYPSFLVIDDKTYNGWDMDMVRRYEIENKN